jgi:hypothetical protein
MIVADWEITCFLSGITGIEHDFGEESRAYLSRISVLGNPGWGNAPFSPGDVEIYEERLSLVPMVLNGLWHRSTGLAAALSEAGPQTVILARDANMSGKYGWFVLHKAEDPALAATSWLSRMVRPCLVAGSNKKGDTLIAAPMVLFF